MSTTRTDVQEAFRAAMGSVASTVSVVTTMADGQPLGSTVSAFLSLSMDPPMLLVSLSRTSRLLAGLHIGSRLGVNVLADHQADIASRFAQSRTDKFDDVAWTLRDGAPALEGHHAWAAMEVTELLATGDHTVVIGIVDAAATGPRAPLTYWRRTFGTHRAH